jgi:hypothetical protein
MRKKSVKEKNTENYSLSLDFCLTYTLNKFRFKINQYLLRT